MQLTWHWTLHSFNVIEILSSAPRFTLPESCLRLHTLTQVLSFTAFVKLATTSEGLLVVRGLPSRLRKLHRMHHRHQVEHRPGIQRAHTRTHTLLCKGRENR